MLHPTCSRNTKKPKGCCRSRILGLLPTIHPIQRPCPSELRTPASAKKIEALTRAGASCTWLKSAPKNSFRSPDGHSTPSRACNVSVCQVSHSTRACNVSACQVSHSSRLKRTGTRRVDDETSVRLAGQCIFVTHILVDLGDDTYFCCFCWWRCLCDGGVWQCWHRHLSRVGNMHHVHESVSSNVGSIMSQHTKIGCMSVECARTL